MDTLVHLKCVACRSDSPPVTADEIAAWLLAEALCYTDCPSEQISMKAAEPGAWVRCWPRNQEKVERIRCWLTATLERGWLPPVDRVEARPVALRAL